MSEQAIRVEGLVKRYGDLVALAGIDLDIPQGTVFGLLGPNGAGKTTAVRILATILKPDGGHAEVLGHDVVKEAPAVRRRIGLAGQYAAVDANLTGRENLRMVGILGQMPTPQIMPRAAELLEKFELSDAADRPFLLVPRRENRVINSTGRNIPGLMRGRTYNPAFMNPDDLAELDLTPGDVVEIRSAHDAVMGIVEADADLRRGVVSMSHGFGGNPGETEDPRVDGANTNRLLRSDVDYDPITGMPRMGAVPISVSAGAS
jgi:ABC-type lipopolysaccharide export system ATPase subunit